MQLDQRMTLYFDIFFTMQVFIMGQRGVGCTILCTYNEAPVTEGDVVSISYSRVVVDVVGVIQTPLQCVQD